MPEKKDRRNVDAVMLAGIIQNRKELVVFSCISISCSKYLFISWLSESVFLSFLDTRFLYTSSLIVFAAIFSIK